MLTLSLVFAKVAVIGHGFNLPPLHTLLLRSQQFYNLQDIYNKMNAILYMVLYTWYFIHSFGYSERICPRG